MNPWIETDVLVIGAGAAGWPAAIGAAREGARVVLLDDDPFPGGAAVDQFVSMPDGGPRSGVVRQYLDQLQTRFPMSHRPMDKWWYFWFMPSDILRVVNELIAAEKGIRLVCPARASRLTTSADGSVVTGALVPDELGAERWIRAKVVIESTGSGALCEAVGCEVRYGEDSREDFGEVIAPEERSAEVQMCTWMYTSHRVPGLAAEDPAYIPPGLESGYQSATASEPKSVLARGFGSYLHWGCKVECRDTRDPVALADAQREALDVMAPDLDALRRNGYVVNLAPRIGVREQRRIMGDYVITATDLFEGNIPDDSVHVTQRPIDIWRKGAHDQMSAYPEVRPYGIPYRALIPKHFEGLFVVGKHLSGTHIAMASYRVQNLLGQIGQATGVAAALCAKNNVRPRQLVFGDLMPRLLSPEQDLVISGDPAWVTPPTPEEDSHKID